MAPQPQIGQTDVLPLSERPKVKCEDRICLIRHSPHRTFSKRWILISARLEKTKAWLFNTASDVFANIHLGHLK